MLSATVIIVEVISYKSSLGCPGENFIPYVINYSADGGSCQRDFGERGSLQIGNCLLISNSSCYFSGRTPGVRQQLGKCKISNAKHTI